MPKSAPAGAGLEQHGDELRHSRNSPLSVRVTTTASRSCMIRSSWGAVSLTPRDKQVASEDAGDRYIQWKRWVTHASRSPRCRSRSRPLQLWRASCVALVAPSSNGNNETRVKSVTGAPVKYLLGTRWRSVSLPSPIWGNRHTGPAQTSVAPKPPNSPAGPRKHRRWQPPRSYLTTHSG